MGVGERWGERERWERGRGGSGGEVAGGSEMGEEDRWGEGRDGRIRLTRRARPSFLPGLAMLAWLRVRAVPADLRTRVLLGEGERWGEGERRG